MLRDIMPWNSPHGGTHRIGRGKSETTHNTLTLPTTGTTGPIVCGTPVCWSTVTGLLRQCVTAPAVQQVTGVALGPNSNFVYNSTASAQVFANGGVNAQVKNPETGVAFVNGDFIPFAYADTDTFFITKNFTTDSTNWSTSTIVQYGTGGPPATSFTTTTGTGDVPTLANAMGVPCGLAKITQGTTDIWGIDTNATTTGKICRIVDVLDKKRKSLTVQGAGAGYYVVFVIESTSLNAGTATVVGPAA